MKNLNEVKGFIMEGLNKKEKAMVIAAAALIGIGSIAFYAMLIKVLFNIIF